ncbi:hypothetical protein MSAN_01932400 [Mycena sanguinolenta]|uniref:DUF6534 domain-containing protein n=1 Tax=Mycena sanguinolenta TaxID=230812 RepID=A0A8H6XMM3_9AGAR|nr:hypothetical protein MSAN_01932400 [Mycena sanguinolenta]
MSSIQRLRVVHFSTMSTTLPRLDAITGALLIATWASSLLYMAELLQAAYYFRNFKKDSGKLKSYVAAAFAIDTISAIGDYASVYLPTITHAGASAGLLNYFSTQLARSKGDFVYLTKQNWTVPLYVISTNCVAMLVQSFLAFRYWRLTNNTIIACFLSILILTAFGGALFSGLTMALFPTVKDRNKVRISGTSLHAASTSSQEFLRTSSSLGRLFGKLMMAKSMLKGRRRVNNMLNRLVLHTIQTGTVTAVIAALGLVVFLIDDQNNISMGIMYTLGRVYVLSMLINLNIRDSDRHKNWTISGGQRGTLGFAQGTTDNVNICSIQFHHIEPQSSNSGTVKSNVLLPTSQSIASISKTRPQEIEMAPTDTKQVPEV